MVNVTKPVLVTGGCGFVGRHLVRALIKEERHIWVVDDLSFGAHPDEWLGATAERLEEGVYQYVVGGSVVTFLHRDLLQFLYTNLENDTPLLPAFGDVFHLASIVGGRALIDGDPIRVATDLAIDAVFFLWVTRQPGRAERILYASSSAAYPIDIQNNNKGRALLEDDIRFDGQTFGQPDMTYGWSKLTGEYLSRLVAERYGISVACVRPFSGYGEDQDPDYPVPAIARRVANRENPLTVWGSGQQQRDFVYIDDCITAMFIALDAIHDGSAVNIGSEQPTSFNEICQALAKIEGYEPTIVPLEDKPVGVQARFSDSSRLRALGWQPEVSLEEGLARVLRYAHEAKE